MALKSFLPGMDLSTVIVLDDSMVLLWGYVATVMEGLKCACNQGCVTNKTVVANTDMTIHSSAGHRSVGRSATFHRAVVTASLAVMGAAYKTLALSDQVVLKIGTHLSSHALSMLIKHFA